jgi:HK97 family phage portal protein
MNEVKPGLLSRLRLASHVFTSGLPGRPWGRQQVKKAGGNVLVWPSYMTGQPQWQMVDVQTFLDQGYSLNTLIYSAVNYKVRASYAVALRGFEGDPDNPDLLKPNHPLCQLIMRPNDYTTPKRFLGQIISSLNIAGNAYVYFERPKRYATPTEAWCLRPDRVFIVPGSGKDLLGYVYVPEGKAMKDGDPILPENLAHIKLPNPGDRFEGLGYGMSPLAPIAQSADVDNSITRFLKMWFDRGTMPMGMLKFEVPMEPTAVAEVKRRWMEMYGSYENWTDIGVLDQGGEYEQIRPAFNDLGFEVIDERNESRILGPFGVPGILIGTRIGLQRSTLANFEEARRQFWEDTFVPELTMVEEELAYFYQADDGESFARFDLSKVPALKANTQAAVAAFAQAVSTGITKNQAAALLELELGDMPDGDVIYMGAGLQVIYDPNAPKPPPAPVAPAIPESAPAPEPEPVAPEPAPAEDPGTNVGAPDAAGDTQDAGKKLKRLTWKGKRERKAG